MSVPEDRDPPTPPSSRELLATLILRLEERHEQERKHDLDRYTAAMGSTEGANRDLRLEVATLRAAVEARTAVQVAKDKESGEFWGRVLAFLTAPGTIAAMSGPASVAVYLLARSLGLDIPTEHP